MRHFLVLVLLTLFAIHAAADTTITYQGQLQDNGQPFDGQTDLTFELFDDFDPNDPSIGNSLAGPISVSNVVVDEGLFQVEIDFGMAYTQPAWLEISVDSDTLNPRQRIRPTPVATHSLGVAEGVSGIWTKNGDTVEYFAASQGMAIIPEGQSTTGPRIIMGHSDNQANEAGAAVSGGGAWLRGNVADGFYSTVGGGIENIAGGSRSTVSGGDNNTANGQYSAIPGGLSNEALGTYSFAAGRRAKANHNGSFIWADSVDADFSSTGQDQFLVRASGGVGIGTNQPEQALHVNGNIELNGWVGTSEVNTLEFRTADRPTLRMEPSTDPAYGPNIIAGYSGNKATGDPVAATIGGGGIANFDFGTGTITGINEVAASYSTIGGGTGNLASSAWTTVAGGERNNASAEHATIAGGQFNNAQGDGSAIGGGTSNTAGSFATVPGGFGNEAIGENSFAAGLYANAAHDGSFVWSDLTASSSASFSSTGTNQFLVNATGGVGIGTNSPRNQLDVVRNQSGSSTNANHVMVVDNTATSQGNVLGLRTNAATPGAAENFITFKAASSNVGAIEGDGSGGITLTSGSADFAEYLRVADGAADIRPADVVGVVGDTVSLQTEQADRAMVVSTRPIMTGNDPGLEAGDRDGHVPVAFLGQVPVRVSGPVNASDYLIPSGLNDGTGIGVPPGELSAQQLPQVVGRALEDAESESDALVKTLVGLPHTAIMASAIERRDLRLEQLESRVTEQGQQLVGLHEVNAELHHELDRMAKRNAELRETVHSLVGAHEQSRELKERIAKLEALLLQQSELARH